MALTTLRTPMIAMIVALMCFVGMSAFLTGIVGEYGVAIDGNQSQLYDDINDSLASLDTLGQGMETGLTNTEISSTFGEAGIIQAVFSVLKLPFQMVEIGIDLINLAASYLPIPAWFLGGIITIILITISFMLLSAVLRKDV